MQLTHHEQSYTTAKTLYNPTTISDWQPKSLELEPTRRAKTELNNFYALLIEIDRYEPNPYSVNRKTDLNLVASYIQNTLNVPQNNIWQLTSPFEETNTPDGFSSAPQKVKPTYENIVKAFREIAAQAQSGDLIYIHYSGSRADVEMTPLLQRLNDKGCIVTVIFDTSHFGDLTSPELSPEWLQNASDYVLIADSNKGKDHLIINSRKSIIQEKRGFMLKKTQLTVWLKTKILLMLK